MKSYLLASASSVLVASRVRRMRQRSRDPGAGDDPGTGTSTLTVDGNVEARPRLTNARSAADFDTELLGPRSSSTASRSPPARSTMTSAGGMVSLTYNPNNGGNNNGRWEGTAAGYDEVYILDVVSGHGPGDRRSRRWSGHPRVRHPRRGRDRRFDASPLPVTWISEDTADSTALRVGEARRDCRSRTPAAIR